MRTTSLEGREIEEEEDEEVARGAPMDSSLLDKEDLLPATEAARTILDVSHGKLTTLLMSGELPSVAHPLDRRFRLVSRADAELLARKLHPVWISLEEAARRLDVDDVREVGEMIREGILTSSTHPATLLAVVAEGSVEALARRLREARRT